MIDPFAGIYVPDVSLYGRRTRKGPTEMKPAQEILIIIKKRKEMERRANMQINALLLFSSPTGKRPLFLCRFPYCRSNLPPHEKRILAYFIYCHAPVSASPLSMLLPAALFSARRKLAGCECPRRRGSGWERSLALPRGFVYNYRYLSIWFVGPGGGSSAYAFADSWVLPDKCRIGVVVQRW